MNLFYFRDFCKNSKFEATVEQDKLKTILEYKLNTYCFSAVLGRNCTASRKKYMKVTVNCKTFLLHIKCSQCVFTLLQSCVWKVLHLKI